MQKQPFYCVLNSKLVRHKCEGLRTGESGPGGNFLLNDFLWIWSWTPKSQLLGVHGLHLFADGLQNVEHIASGILEVSCLTEALLLPHLGAIWRNAVGVLA